MRARKSLLAMVILALAAACTFTTKYDPEKYWRCGPGGFCPDGCQCLDGQVCVPGSPGLGPEDCAWCPDGFVDCDGSVANGCEADLAHDPRNCGSCGTICAANEFCVAGQCLGGCPETYTPCGSLCVDTSSDPNHCGSCNHSCPEGQVCSRGVCTGSCDPELTDCSGACVDVSSNPAHCGSCGSLCALPHALPYCRQGVCGVADCLGTFANCDGNEKNGCEVDTAEDRFNCGSCGHSCAPDTAKAACDSGTCGCPGGWGDCDGLSENGCETLLTDNLLHCGVCGHDCFAERAGELEKRICLDSGDIMAFNPKCDGVSCQVVPRWEPCGGDCIDGFCYGALCGENGERCDPDEYCQDGECYCGDGQCGDNERCCSGSCVDTTTDNQNCGDCGHVCPANSTCRDGTCQCQAGYADCNGDLDNELDSNGCETSLADNANCGSCGNACPSHSHCRAGTLQCTCEPDWGDCDDNHSNGCETYLLSNYHCGSCDTVCSYNSQCVLDSDGTIACDCLPGYGDCDGDAANGCESCDPNCNMAQCSDNYICCQGPGNSCVDPNANPANCGGCGQACPGGFDCLEGVCHSPGVPCGGNTCGIQQYCCLTTQELVCTGSDECLAAGTGLLMQCDDTLDCVINGDGNYCCQGSDPYFSTCSADCPVFKRLCASDADCDDGSETRYFCCPEHISAGDGSSINLGLCRNQPC